MDVEGCATTMLLLLLTSMFWLCQPLLQGSSLFAAVQNWYNGLPLCTKATFSLIMGIFIVQLLTGWYGSQSTAVSLVPHAVLYDYQVYRFFTAVLVHGGLLHVTFNMLAFVPIGASLERAAGTWQLLHFMLLSCFLEGVIYAVVSGLLAASGLVHGALFHGAVGFSGVIFGLLVWDSALLSSSSSSSHRSIFGLFHVPAPWYPWVLLLLCQLMLPEASLLGHLAGLLVGQLWVWGYLRPLALPRSAVLWLEQSSPLASRCVRLPSFVTMPSSGLPYSTCCEAAAGRGAGGSNGSEGVRLGALGRNLHSLGKLFRSGFSGGGDVGGSGGGGGGGGGGGDDVEAAGAEMQYYAVAEILRRRIAGIYPGVDIVGDGK
ncbi:hypothetical protein VOLCADRAFT_99376 [Volvox carteri f. nagariensis]|uniref:Peptidase S54 rhomboid domain-containing protein n=1 Tax=Volvox carteri f. nagariensis TaxID=3068 RepID=D8UHN4_VOLCA|nr:uncharacterized protein VOLCADRAFT_99376 [Volvox carteri f. nagariensis]EFJ40799.1 hypothetical protein VOLCADRAFT_99376 [Volvox carteri f. nagariensis]|eukprot:XP_002958174.1 hypothetical protein VOLCADRAFT_99376 [Volvox carteri f. nagariensis]